VIVVSFYVGLIFGILFGYVEAVKRVATVTIKQLRDWPDGDVIDFSDELDEALIPARIRRRMDRHIAEHSDDRGAAGA
jgi:hypothetical protein